MSERPLNDQPKMHAEMCGFCGKPQKQCTLLMKSTVTNHTICSLCAMTIVQQSMLHMTSTSSMVNALMKEYPQMFEQDEKTGAVTVVPATARLDDALEQEHEGETGSGNGQGT